MNTPKNRLSIFANKDVFGLAEGRYGSGWPALHVTLNDYEKSSKTGDAMLLTRDAQNYEEFELHIEELKTLLDDLKRKAKRRFEKLDSETKQ